MQIDVRTSSSKTVGINDLKAVHVSACLPSPDWLLTVIHPGLASNLKESGEL